MLYLLPFILAAIAFLHFSFGMDEGIVCREDGIISFPFLNENQHLLWLRGMGMFGLLCLAFLIFFIADRYKFLSRITALPALIYALLTAGLVCRYGVNNYLLAAFCSVLAVSRLQSAIVHTKSNAPVLVLVYLRVWRCCFVPNWSCYCFGLSWCCHFPGGQISRI